MSQPLVAFIFLEALKYGKGVSLEEVRSKPSSQFMRLWSSYARKGLYRLMFQVTKRGRGNPELVELLGEKCVGIDVNSMKPLDNLWSPHFDYSGCRGADS